MIVCYRVPLGYYYKARIQSNYIRSVFCSKEVSTLLHRNSVQLRPISCASHFVKLKVYSDLLLSYLFSDVEVPYTRVIYKHFELAVRNSLIFCALKYLIATDIKHTYLKIILQEVFVRENAIPVPLCHTSADSRGHTIPARYFS